MKKIALLGLCLMCGTGCGRGWLPRLFHGAPCMGRGCLNAPLAPCQNCPTPSIGANYGGYESYGDTYGSNVVGEQFIGGTEPFMGNGTIMDGRIINDPSSLQTMESIQSGAATPPAMTPPPKGN